MCYFDSFLLQEYYLLDPGVAAAAGASTTQPIHKYRAAPPAVQPVESRRQLYKPIADKKPRSYDASPRKQLISNMKKKEQDEKEKIFIPALTPIVVSQNHYNVSRT